MGHFVPVLPPGTKASSLLSRKANPGSKTGTNGPMEPGQKAVFVVVIVAKRGIQAKHLEVEVIFAKKNCDDLVKGYT